MSAQPPGAPRRRASILPGWPLVASALVIVAALGGGVTLLMRLPAGGSPAAAAARSATAGHSGGPASATPCPDGAAQVTPCPRTVVADPASASASHRPGPRRGAATTPHPRPASPAPRSSAAARPGGHATPTPASTPSATGPAASQSLAVKQVLALINRARAAAGLPAYTLSARLDTSAGRHNTVMAAGCGLSHQCPGEPALGARETAAGVRWTAAGENIGDGGPVGGSAAAIARMAVNLTQSMLNEKPPDDGHRLNILSATFSRIGIAVSRDASGTVWMTQDFAN
jgi:uncharacterized protein YkwD